MFEPFIIIENKDHASWLKARTYGIGGSDASAIVGMNPYKTNIDLFEGKRQIFLRIFYSPGFLYNCR